MTTAINFWAKATSFGEDLMRPSPAGIYQLIVNKRKTRTRCEIYTTEFTNLTNLTEKIILFPWNIYFKSSPDSNF